MRLMDSRRASIAGAAAIVILLGAVNLYYFLRSQTPTFWDDSSYLTGSLNLYDALTDKGIPGFASTFAHLYGNKAPLICVFPIPIYFIFGRDYDPRCLVDIGFLILMSVYLFRLGASLWSPREGLLAVAILQTMPLFYGLSRQFLVDYGLAAMVVMWMYYLLCYRSLTDAGAIVRLGILFGIGMLMKISFPLYIGAPTIVATFVLLRTNRDWRKVLKILGALGCIFLIGGLIASSWYINNLKTVVGFAAGLGFGQQFISVGSTNVFTWSVISNHFYVLIVVALSCYYAFLLTVLLPAWTISMWRNRPKGTSHALALFVWVAVPFAVTTFAVTKDPRYTAPIWPPVALFLARMIGVIFGRWRLYPAAVAVLMIVPALAYASASLPAMERFGGLKFGRWLFWSPHLAWYASIPSSDGAWGQQEIAREVCRDAERAPPGARLFIPLAHQYLNNVNLEYFTKRLKCNVQVIGLPSPLQTPKAVADFIDDVNPLYVLVVPNVPEPQFAPMSENAMKEEAEKLVTRPDSGFQLLNRRSLGATGKEILIYRRNCAACKRAPENEPSAEPSAATVFGDELSLTGYSIGDKNGRTQIELRWKALRRPSSDYFVFVHALDRAGTIAFQGDHQLKNVTGAPAGAWSAGESVQDRFILTPSANRPAGKYALRIGVYIPRPMKVLQLTKAAFPQPTDAWKNQAVMIADVECK